MESVDLSPAFGTFAFEHVVDVAFVFMVGVLFVRLTVRLFCCLPGKRINVE